MTSKNRHPESVCPGLKAVFGEIRSSCVIGKAVIQRTNDNFVNIIKKLLQRCDFGCNQFFVGAMVTPVPVGSNPVPSPRRA